MIPMLPIGTEIRVFGQQDAITFNGEKGVIFSNKEVHSSTYDYLILFDKKFSNLLHYGVFRYKNNMQRSNRLDEAKGYFIRKELVHPYKEDSFEEDGEE